MLYLKLRCMDMMWVDLWFMEHKKSPGRKTNKCLRLVLSLIKAIIILRLLNHLFITTVMITVMFYCFISTACLHFVSACVCVLLKTLSKVIQIHPSLLQNGFNESWESLSWGLLCCCFLIKMQKIIVIYIVYTYLCWVEHLLQCSRFAVYSCLV